MISASIIGKARLMEPLILCHVFPQRSQDKEEVLGHFGHLLFELNPATPNSYRRCACLLSAQIPEMRPGKRRPSPRSRRRCLIARRISKELCIIKHRENSRTRCQEKNTRPAVATNTCPLLKKLGRDCLYLPIGRT